MPGTDAGEPASVKLETVIVEGWREEVPNAHSAYLETRVGDSRSYTLGALARDALHGLANNPDLVIDWLVEQGHLTFTGAYEGDKRRGVYIKEVADG